MLWNGTLALAALGSAGFLANPSLAVETNPPARPELVAPHADVPDFQLDWACCDDQTVNDHDVERSRALLVQAVKGFDPQCDVADLVQERRASSRETADNVVRYPG